VAKAQFLQRLSSKKGVFWRGELPSYTYSNWTEQLFCPNSSFYFFSNTIELVLSHPSHT